MNIFMENNTQDDFIFYNSELEQWRFVKPWNTWDRLFTKLRLGVGANRQWRLRCPADLFYFAKTT